MPERKNALKIIFYLKLGEIEWEKKYADDIFFGAEWLWKYWSYELLAGKGEEMFEELRAFEKWFWKLRELFFGKIEIHIF